MTTKITPSEYNNWIKNNRPDYVAVGTYVNTKTKILHKHIETGVEWLCTPEKFKLGIKPTQLTQCQRWNEEKYKKYLIDNNIAIKLVGKFKRQNIQTLHQCLKTNKIFKLCPLRIIKNKNFVFNDIVDNTEKYKKWLEQNYPELEILEPYKTSVTKIKHRHKISGYIWNVKPNNVIERQRHPCEKLNSASRRSIKWLDGIATKENIFIQHKLNGGEVKINGVGKVDGFCAETNTVYEFHGDFWHGNPKKFNKNDINRVNKKTFGQLHKDTLKRHRKIRNKGYRLMYIWESDFIKNQ